MSFVLQITNDVNVQDMMTLVRHMLLNGGLPEETDTKFLQVKVTIPHATHY